MAATVLGIMIYAPNALALKRAPFPNSTPLQPIPANVQPNISANVNSDTGSAPPVDQGTQSVPGDNQTEPSAPTSTSGLGLYFYLGIGAGIATVFLVRYYLKRRE